MHISKNQIFKHYKNNHTYEVIDFCKIQENDVWVEAVLYKPTDCDELFVRPLQEFKEKFSLVN